MKIAWSPRFMLHACHIWGLVRDPFLEVGKVKKIFLHLFWIGNFCHIGILFVLTGRNCLGSGIKWNWGRPALN